MTKDDAVALVMAINRLQPHVSPLLFESLANCRAVSVAQQVANGLLVCTVGPPAPEQPAAAALGADKQPA